MPLWTSEGMSHISLGEISADTKTTPFERRFNPYDFNGGYTFYIYIFNYHSLIPSLYLERLLLLLGVISPSLLDVPE